MPVNLYMNNRVIDSLNFHEGQFKNAAYINSQYHWQSILKFIITKKLGEWPSWIENKNTPSLNSQENNNQVVVTFINHATFLIKIGNTRIITDPIFSTFAGPFGLIGPKRRRKPGIAINDLPKIDIILISHNHYDHLDLPSLHKIQKMYNTTVVVPLGNKEWLMNEGIKNIQELDWWEYIKMDNKLEIHFVPSQHFSGRGLFDNNQSLWGGYVIVDPLVQIYHAGDTGYSHHFTEIGKKFNIDISLLPFGAYKPQWFLQSVHINPAEAWQAHQDLNSKVSIAMHYETFPLSALHYQEAEGELQNVLSKEKVDDNQFNILEVGESYYYNPEMISK